MSQRPASVVAGAPPPPWVDASSHEELRREARVVGLKAIDVPSLEAVERRRVQLWTLSTILLVLLSSAVVVSLWWRPEAAGVRASQLVLRMSALALTIAFAVYCFEKEAQLRGLSHLLLDERMRTVALANRLRELSQLAHLAFHHGLTGVANRALLRARQALARRQPGAVALLFIDLDGFKAVNDRFGHSAGDRLLADGARRLREVVRPSDTVARVGGDEFVVLCEDLADESEAVGVATRIEQALAEPFRLGGGEAKVSASLGIALATEGEGDPETLLRDADTAMYRAKQIGKAGHQVFNATMRRAATARLRTESLLRHALDQSRLRLAYHPVVDLADGSVVAGDAVVRLAGGEGGIVLPDEASRSSS